MPDETNHSPRHVPLRDPSRDKTGSVVVFPRMRSPTRPIDNLPLELTSFIGREREVAGVKRLLSERRLLTLCGPGGSGKTRLALAVAQDLVESFEDGVWWAELASISDPELVPQAVAQALGVPEAPDLSPTEALAGHLGNKKTFLVLDNCEHLVEECAMLADALLRSCHSLRILATSREPLRTAGETSFVVPSLSVPDPGRLPSTVELAGYEAVGLFVERARETDSGFALTEQNAPAVARLCEKLDGIPLAIELAAARTRVLSVEQILKKLEDPLGLLTAGSRTAAARHQTLRATLRWSYGLLSEAEQALFRRLSVFVGGFTLEAAEAVCAGGDVDEARILDLLSRLVDKSLVVAEAEDEGALRYGMLEPVRQYALEGLEEGDEAEETRRRRAAFFAALAEWAHRELRGPGQVGWMRRLGRENDNLRAAIAWALSSGEAETAARLCWALWPFWWYRGNHREGRRLAEAALLGGADLPPELRIQATVAAEIMAYGQADNGAVAGYAGDLIESSRGVGGDAYAEAYARGGLGLVALNRGDLQEATMRLEEALPLFLESGEVWTAAQAHTWLGTVQLLQGDRDGAVARFEEGLALARRIGDRTGTYNALYTLAQVALARGELEPATSGFVEGMGLSEEMGDRANVAYCLEGLAAVAGARAEAQRSARLFGAADGLLETIGVPVWTSYKPDRSLYERTMADVREALGEAAFEAARTEGRAMSFERAIEYALEEPEAPSEGQDIHPTADGVALPPGRATPHAAPAAAVRIFALGPARVEKDGIPIDSPDWVQKSRELLYYLLSYPEGRTKEQIGLALWPEASASQLRSSLHITLYRLRRALGGKEWVSFTKGRYAFERSLDYSYDAEAFEDNLSEARRRRDQAPGQAIRHLEEAADLYGGDFLEELAVEGEWALVRQEELRRAYQEVLLLLGGLLMGQGRHTEAADAYRRSISHDRFLEEAHRGLMRSRAASGETGKALRHYEELVELLEEQLGAKPATETTALYESLRSGE